MDIPKILPDLGSAVSTELLNMEHLEHASKGEILHAATLLMSVASERMADPASYHQLATFSDASGQDWSGFQGAPPTTSSKAGQATATLEQTTQEEQDLDEPVEAPREPENYCDTLPALGALFSKISRFHDSMLAQYSRFLEASIANQRLYLGTPRKTKDFRDVADYLTSTMRISRHQARRIIKRGKYYAHLPGLHPEVPEEQPVFKELATSLVNGSLPTENADKLIDFDEALIKYSHQTHQPVERKDQVLEVFEPVMVETAQSITPDELNGVKKRWMEELAHWICPDGPSPSMALAKAADNALKCREKPDGSAVFSMHTSPAVTARFKKWMLQQLDFHGSPAHISEDAIRLLGLLNTSADHSDTDDNPAPTQDETFDEHVPAPSEATENANAPHTDTPHPNIPAEWLGPMTMWDTSLDPALVVAETADGTPVSAKEMDLVEHLSTGQKMGSILLSQLLAMLSMDPTVLGGKKAHGISAQLMVVQDIETAYHTLGYEPIPKAARRPSGPAGYLPPTIRIPNPEKFSESRGPAHAHRRYGPPDDQDPMPWTRYQSEAVNIGPLHPQDAEILMCNAEITGQIWDGPDQVLHQKRAQRLFTPPQRRAILARDKGCQAPGCTVPADYCDIHHIKAWARGGPTDEDNGIALCPYHHETIHSGRWSIRKHQGLTFFQPARWIDPDQPLLRNAYWNS